MWHVYVWEASVQLVLTTIAVQTRVVYQEKVGGRIDRDFTPISVFPSDKKGPFNRGEIKSSSTGW